MTGIGRSMLRPYKDAIDGFLRAWLDISGQ
jgi:hypothetical protein